MIEVLIVGAGPAGAVTAMLLARRGARVLLVDRARFPRDKLCGDTLNPGAMAILRELGVSDALERVGLPLDGMIVTGATGVRVRGPYGRGQRGLSLMRRALDTHLIEQAVAAGVQFQDGVTVRSAMLEQTDDGSPFVRGAVLTTASGRAVRLPAGITIAADGRRSTLAFALGLARHPPRPRRWAIGAYFQNVEGLESYGEMHVRRGHYLGVAPVPGGLTNACVVTSDRAGFSDPARLLERTLGGDPLLRERFARASRVSEVSCLGPLAVDVTAHGVPGLLLAGDAAGFIDPMTGDGLRFALRGAVMVAEVASLCLEQSDVVGHRVLEAWRRSEFAAK